MNLAAAPTVAVADGEVTNAKLADGAVTQAKLNSSVTFVPAGAIMPFAMNSAPTGWLAANGTAVSRSTYAALFSALGTTYGAGDGSTTFALPDLRGIFVRGSGTQTIDGNSYSGTFAAKQADDLKAHTHTATTASAGSHTHTTAGRYMTVDGGANVTAFGGPGTYPYRSDVNAAGAHTHSVTVNSTGGTETRPANIALLYCIKF
jgi:microcystin-dependent protein